jgi:glycerophosphoryl diester phosphodiesterase
MSLRIIGHRGMGPTSGLRLIPPEQAPENSLRAFEEALRYGADGVECDVAKTSDGHIVIIHDDELNKNVAGADREAYDLGTAQHYTLEQLKRFDIGHGEPIPALTELLDLIVSKDADYYDKMGRHLVVNIELKGEDVVDGTYATMMEYVEQGLLSKEQFIFNSFKWDRLERMRSLDPDVKLVPNMRTVQLFGPEQVSMPGFVVEDACGYAPDGLKDIYDLHQKINIHAIDCVINDMRPPMFDFCREHGVGLYASTSNQRMRSGDLAGMLKMMVDHEAGLPVCMFKADCPRHAKKVEMMLRNQGALQSLPELGLNMSCGYIPN